MWYTSGNRDEEVFKDPYRFDVLRPANDHVAFGFGTHFCLGASLARLELKVMFDHVLDRLPDMALVTPGEPDRRRIAIDFPYRIPDHRVIRWPGPEERAFARRLDRNE